MADILVKKLGAFAISPKKSHTGEVLFYASKNITIFQHETRFIPTQWGISPTDDVIFDFTTQFDGIVRWKPEKEVGIYVHSDTLTPLLLKRGTFICSLFVYRKVIDRTRKRKRSQKDHLLPPLSQVKFLKYREDITTPFHQNSKFKIVVNCISVPAESEIVIDTGLGFDIPSNCKIQFFRCDHVEIEHTEPKEPLLIVCENSSEYPITIEEPMVVAYAILYELVRCITTRRIDYFTSVCFDDTDEEDKACCSKSLFNDPPTQ